jgi:3-hydroxyacyl-CoA dehydrogenase
MTETLETTTVRLEKLGAVLVTTVDNPPVNALSQAVRAGLVAAIERLESDPDAKALVILCAGRTFIAGADIREFGKPLAEPRLGEVIDRLDRCEKPVIAAMHGTALGGGLEVALACSSRIALQTARFGLPEVKLGLLPGSGGIVRLPRLIGVEAALPMIAEGNQIGAAEALDAGLIDAVVSGDLREAAIGHAQRLIDAGAAVRRTSDLPVPAFDPAFLGESRTRLGRKYRGQTAPLLAVDLVEMVTRTPFREAVAQEYAACKELIASPQSRALRHLFAAERAAAKVAGLPEATVPREILRAAVVGPGVMGRGIAGSFLDAGLQVVLVGLAEDSLDAARTAIRKLYGGQVKRGALTEADVDARLSRLTTTTGYDGLGDVDIAIEAVTEDLGTKREVLARLDAALPERAIIATNTSFLDIETLADAVSRPENLAGMHFFNPANVMKLLENVRARRTAPDVLATLMVLGKRLGKVPVLVGRSEGFVANRMLSKRSREAQFLLEDGATPEQVDRVLTEFGFPIGPFALADLAGMDVMSAARAARLPGMTQREKDCDIVDQLAAAGRLGQKSGAGYYRYGDDRKPQPDPAVDALLRRHRADRGRTVREISDREILERCLYAMVNEAAKLLDEGAAARPGDIDVIWTSGFGWPRHLGGPMFWADQIGLPAVKAALDQYSTLVGAEYFAPAPLIERLASEGRGFLD